MVDPKRRIRGRGEQVTAWIAANDIVDAAVGSDFDGVRDALGQETVLLDVGFREEVWIESVGGSQALRDLARLTQHGAVIRISLVERRPNIPLQRSWIVSQPAIGTGSRIVQTAHRTKIDRHVGKWPSRDIAAADTGWQLQTRLPIRRLNHRSIVLDGLSITAEACIAAVEDRRVLRRMSVLWPVPVRLVAFVAALFAESLLVRVDEPAVPGREDAREVDVESLLDVHDSEVVESRSCSRRDVCRSSRWEALETQDRMHVVESLFTREGAVFSSDCEILERAFRFFASGVQLGFALFQ
jgi:hypothetical protein